MPHEPDPPPAPPDYGRATLAEVLPSAAAALGAPGMPNALGLEDSSAVVVLLVDGLGDLLIDPVGAPRLDAARRESGRRLAAGFPSTTPVGLGTLGTGLPPGGHGLMGASFRLPDDDRVLWPLGWKGDPHPNAVQPEPTVFERVVRAGIRAVSVSSREFESTGLTRAALRGPAYRGADSIGERVGEVSRALAESRSGEPVLVYAYWGALDRTGHVQGVDSEHWRAELAHVDLVVAQLAELLRPGQRLLVTADHGMVDCAADSAVWIEDHPALGEGVAVIAGEPRARHVYARPGAAAEVAAAWKRTLEGRAWVLSREEAVAAGWFGEVADDYLDRIGDVVAAASGTTLLASREVDPVVSRLLGQHGSLTDHELAIPLIEFSG